MSRLIYTAATLTLLIWPSVALAGLGPEFGRALFFAAIRDMLVWTTYAVSIVLAVWWVWRGKLVRSLCLGATVFAVGWVYPALDRISFFAEQADLRAAFLTADEIDIREKRIMIISRGACHDLCRALINHGVQSELYVASLTAENDAEFIETGQLPDSTFVKRMMVPNDGYPTGEHVPVSDINGIEYIMLLDFYAGIGDVFSDRYPPDVKPQNAGVSVLFAPVDGIENIRFDTLEPDVLMYYHRRSTYNFPLHPFRQLNSSLSSYRERDRYLADLVCPQRGMRLRWGCTEPG